MKKLKQQMLKQQLNEKKACGCVFASFGDKPPASSFISVQDIFSFMKENNIQSIQNIFGHFVIFHKKRSCDD